ncbi:MULTISPECIES: TetR/AcrR family transcriptional regulator [unclassified Streptomyces]|uniref:TetR/AcrR family transcriptional regulator n=1 Tax=unclassified Streptomyces TaxID=2593676 RepID=UPI000C27CD7A|nr:TetR/AcrR family transcriptional regulator [Streptomyces sp. CB02959]PJN37181.1 TetR family transcriptional regulator [Streptomyces sp. CB02959]
MLPARTSATAPPGQPKPGLRERKKIQTRQAIRRAALRLFAAQGYDATPTDRIAEAAEVSPSTVFRYFPAKEDIVLTDEYNALLADGIRARPAGEPFAETLRHVTVGIMRGISATDREELLQRIRLIRDVPAVRGRTAELTARHIDTISTALAERTGRPADDLGIRVIGAAALAALQEAMLRWAEESRTASPEELIHRSMDVLAHGLTL